jgi:hypothetical protein
MALDVLKIINLGMKRGLSVLHYWKQKLRLDETQVLIWRNGTEKGPRMTELYTNIVDVAQDVECAVVLRRNRHLTTRKLTLWHSREPAFKNRPDYTPKD